MSIRIVSTATERELVAFNRLLPQLSSSFTALSLEDLTAIVEAASNTVFVYDDGEDILGTLTLVLFAMPTGVRAWIEDVVVDEAARGRGVGDALVRAALDHARAHHAKTVDLTSRPSRAAAHALYERVGFTVRETNVYRYSLEA